MVTSCNCEVAVFADDLDTYKIFDHGTTSNEVLAVLGGCADRVHEWGAANQVVFGPGKEAFCILDRPDYFGDAFSLPGVDFDPQLLMDDFCTALASRLPI